MKPRTSQTHPIRVDWLPENLAGMPGWLGMTFAPGKSATSAFDNPWQRDLATDVASTSYSNPKRIPSRRQSQAERTRPTIYLQSGSVEKRR